MTTPPGDEVRIGVDQWVEQSEERREQYSGWTAPARRLLDTLSPGWRLTLFLFAAAIYPLLVSSSDVRIGITILLLAMVALGLNVVVGWAGLLDLGFVAFYGFGAYFYAIVASDQLPAHWPTWIAVPIIVAASAALGALLSLPSRRLVGDYLAIMTLFFAQIFVELVRNFERLPFVSDDLNLTGGPNGIIGIEPWELFGFKANMDDLFGGILPRFSRQYYVALILLGLLIVGLHNLNNSRTGRAWRALREDTLAAEHMTTPVNRMKLLAFAVGAGIAGLTGALFAAVQVGVFPNNFNLFILITMYAAVILGGSGSIPGVVLGAMAIAYVPELLRDPGPRLLQDLGIAGWVFYLGLIVLLIVVVKRWERIAAIGAGVIVFGFIVRFFSSRIWDESTMGTANDTLISRFTNDWVLILGEQKDLITNYAFIAAIAGVVFVVLAHGWWKVAALIPTIYLAILAWENRLAVDLVRDSSKAGWLFYLGLIAVLILMIKRWERIAAVGAGVIVFGFIVRFFSSRIWDESTMGEANDSIFSRLVDDWVLILDAQRDLLTNYAFVLVIVGVMVVVVASGWWRIAALVPTIYLAILVWENKLAFEPSITRQLMFGAVLVVMMAVRPQGLLGTRRVEIT